MSAEHRLVWAQKRAAIEEKNLRSTPLGEFERVLPRWVEPALDVFSNALKLVGLHGRGLRNALDVRTVSFDLSYPDLPQAFDGYRILHITDPHLDMLDGIDEAIAKATSNCQADVCLMTGDYRDYEVHPMEAVLEPLERMIRAIKTPDGIYATLGNHDDHKMAGVLENLGVKTLINETAYLERNGQRIYLSGLDDVNQFYTPEANKALRSFSDGFSIALVHSPEMAEEAAKAGYKLYLCGHTHGGQICLPNGHAPMTRLVKQHDYAKGLWRQDQMVGYTSFGAGISGLPLRFFTKGEISLITLRASKN
jgi:uncharacterized protein